MKKTFAILFLLVLSGCYITQPNGYIDYRERRMLDWDPIYYVPGYYDPFFYRYSRPIPPTIIYRDRYVPTPSRPQQPRVENTKPYSPSVPQSPRTGSAPIRTFPKKDDNKEQ